MAPNSPDLVRLFKIQVLLILTKIKSAILTFKFFDHSKKLVLLIMDLYCNVYHFFTKNIKLNLKYCSLDFYFDNNSSGITVLNVSRKIKINKQYLNCYSLNEPSNSLQRKSIALQINKCSTKNFTNIETHRNILRYTICQQSIVNYIITKNFQI